MIKKIYYRDYEVAEAAGCEKTDVLRLTDVLNVAFKRTNNGKRLYSEASKTLIVSEVKRIKESPLSIVVEKRRRTGVPRDWLTVARRLAQLTIQHDFVENSERRGLKTLIRNEILNLQNP